MGTNVINLEAVRAARAIADEFDAKLGDEIKRAKKNGFVLKYRVEAIEKLGGGEAKPRAFGDAVVRLLPESNRARTRLHRMGQAFIEAHAEYEDPSHTIEAVKAAVDAAFELATDAGVFR